MNAIRGKRIAILGGGTMGSALLEGLLAQRFARRSLIVADPSAAARRRIRTRGVRATADNVVAVCRAHIVILAIKPQQLRPVLARLRRVISTRQLVISVAAGVPLRVLERSLRGVPMVRVMPNLPATVGQGFAALAPNRRATTRHRAMARTIFGAVGEAVEVPERLLDAVTAVSGSGPAYLFYVAQAWQEAAVQLGLSRALAERAIGQTLAGSLALLREGARSPEAWIRRVASKRGTTEAALRVLRRRRVGAHLGEAVRAAARRSKQLSRG